MEPDDSSIMLTQETIKANYNGRNILVSINSLTFQMEIMVGKGSNGQQLKQPLDPTWSILHGENSAGKGRCSDKASAPPDDSFFPA